jgi:uncharacterized membrane protein YfcA
MEAFFSDPAVVTLIAITLLAATVNGALGYGFSSLTVPVALLFYANRVLNPALVLLEVILNSYVLLTNYKSVPRVWQRVFPLFAGLLPGVLVGSYILTSVHPGWVKLLTYAIILPLILIQAAGVRKYIRAEKIVSIPFGVGIGVLYSVTTISGPPLALLFNNQGYAKQDFRAGLALIRMAESSLTAAAYYFLGLYSVETPQLMSLILPSVLIGIPLGGFLIRRIATETFRRVCMSFDAWIVGFGLSRTLIELGVAVSLAAYSVLAATLIIDGILLARFFLSTSSKHETTVIPSTESLPGYSP